MALNAKIVRTSRFVVKVNAENDRLSTSTPITLKNQVSEINSIEDINDVSEVDVTSGSTLVYNANNDLYEIRKISTQDLGQLDIDGGTF